MPTRPNQYAITASALSPDPRQSTTLARQLNFPGLLFDAFSPSLNIADLSATGLREFRHILSAQDRQLVGFRADFGPKGLGPGADVDRILSQLQKVLEATTAIASPLLCLDLGPLPEPPKHSKPKPKITQAQAGLLLIPAFAAPEPDPIPPPDRTPAERAFTAQVDAALFEIGVLTDRYSMPLALHTDLSSFAALEHALQAAHCPWFGINFDPAAALRDEWSIDEVFDRLGSLIRHVRARDAIVGADRRTKPAAVGRGDSKWDHLLDNLHAADYHGWITFDPNDLPDRSTAAIAGLKYLRLHETD